MSSTAYTASKGASQSYIVEASQSVSHVPYYEDSSPSQSSPSALSSGQIAAIAIGTVLAVGMVCLLLFCPQLMFAYLRKSRPRSRSSGNKDVPLEDIPQRPGPARGNDGSGNGVDDAGSRRRRSEVVLGSTQSHGNQIIIRGRSGSRVTINNNIHINSNDYLHPLPALDSRRNRDPALPELDAPRNAQRAPRLRNIQRLDDPPNGGIPLQRRRHDRNPAPVPRVPTAERSEASRFWNVEEWAHGIAPGQTSRSPSRRRPGSPLSTRERRPTRRVEEGDRSFDVPGAFPGDDEAEERFHLVTAPARVHAPGAPVHGDNRFWVRDARENRWRRQEKEDRRK